MNLMFRLRLNFMSPNHFDMVMLTVDETIIYLSHRKHYHLEVNAKQKMLSETKVHSESKKSLIFCRGLTSVR